MFSFQLFAQQKDSLKLCESSCVNNHNERRFHFGVKIMSGVNYYTSGGPNGFIKEYYSGSLLQIGVISSYNLNNKWRLNCELRFGKRTGKIYINSNIVSADFNLSGQEIQFPLYAEYTFFNKRKVNLFSLGFGLIYEQFLIHNNSNLINGNFYFYSTQDILSTTCYSYLFAINKNFHISKSSILFIGFEYNQQLNLSTQQNINFEYTDNNTLQTNKGFFKPLYTNIFLTTGIKF